MPGPSGEEGKRPVTDVIVVGGGPTGLASAIMARLAGLSVIVFEPRDLPADKACGEGLMPPALKSLADLGVTGLEGVAFEGIRYVDGACAAEGRFAMGPGLGVRRTVLHKALHDRARALNIDIRPKRVETWSQDADGVTVEGERARWLLGADGLASPLRARLGLSEKPRLPTRLGLRRHFNVEPWTPFVEIHWHEDAEAYVTPISATEVGVAILYKADAEPPGTGDPWTRWFSAFPELAARVGSPSTTVRGAGPFEQRVRAPRAGRVLLIGDAAGYLDPITGEGIRLGLDTARAAVDSIIANQPEHYPRRWRQAIRRYWWLTAGLLFLRRREWLRKQMVPTLRRWPRLFNLALNVLNHS